MIVRLGHGTGEGIVEAIAEWRIPDPLCRFASKAAEKHPFISALLTRFLNDMYPDRPKAPQNPVAYSSFSRGIRILICVWSGRPSSVYLGD